MAENKDLKVYVCIPQTENKVSNIATIEAVINKIAFNNGIAISLIKQSENSFTISEEAEIIRECDIVIADFIPTADTGKDPHPDSLMAAVFARYIYGKKLIILHNEELENYWSDLDVCEFSRQDSNDSFDCLYDSLVETIDSDETFEIILDRNPENNKIFVTSPFQGRFFHVRNDFNFMLVFSSVDQAAEEFDLSDNVITSAYKMGGEIEWNDLYIQLSQTKVLIADVSPDVDSGIYPNAHVLTEYLVAKYGFGIEPIITVCRKDEKHEDGHWTRFDSWEYEPFSANLDVEETNLTEILKEEINKGFNPVEETEEEDESFEDAEIVEEEIETPEDDDVVIEKAEIASEKVVVNPDIFEDLDKTPEKTDELKETEDAEEQISQSELPMNVMEDSDESSETTDVDQKSETAAKEGIVGFSQIPESKDFEKDEFDTLDYFASSETADTPESAKTVTPEDDEMISRPDKQHQAKTEDVDLSNKINYDDDDEEMQEASARIDMKDKDADYTAWDDETEMNLYDPDLHRAQSQIYQLELSREKARKRSMSTSKFKLQHRLTSETVDLLNLLYKDLKWAVIGKKKIACLQIMFKIMRLSPFDKELTNFIKLFPDLYDNVAKEIHEQIIDFLKFDSDKGKLMLVDAEGSGDYLTINEAYENSNNGDIILIMKGEYEESLEIVDKELTVRGLTEDLKPTMIAENSNVLTLKKTKSIISNIAFKQTGGKGFNAVDVVDCSPIIENCDITSQSNSCMHILGRNAQPFIRYNKLHDCNIGFLIENQARPKIKLNEIWNCKKEAIKVDKVSDPNINQNLIRNNLVGISINGASKGVYYRNELIANKQENIYKSSDSNPVLKDNRAVSYFKYYLPDLKKFLEADDMAKAQEIWQQLKPLALKDPRLFDILSTYPELDLEFYEQNKDKLKDIKKEEIEWDFEPEEMTLDVDGDDAAFEMELEEFEEPEEEIDLEQLEREKEEQRKREEEEERQRKIKQAEEDEEHRLEILAEAKRIARERLAAVEPELVVTGEVYLVDHSVEGAFEIIQEAINYVQDGDVILIAPREYDENLYITYKTITLVGEKIDYAPLIKRESGSCLRLIESSSTILNIDFVQKGGGNFYAVDIDGCSPTLENCSITCESIAGIGIYNENADPVIVGNKFEKGSIGIKVSKSAKGKIIGNEFVSLSKSAVSISTEAEPYVSKNTINESYMGIQVSSKGRGRFEENTIENTTKPGITLSKESQCEITRNKIHDLDIGIQIAGSSWASVEDNEIKNTNKIGIAVTKHSDVTIMRNAIKDAQVGIQYTEGSQGVIDNNELIRCSKVDMLISDDCVVEVGDNTTKSIVEDTIEKMKVNIENGEIEEASAKWLLIFNEEYHNPLVKEVLMSYLDFEPEYKQNIRKSMAENDPDVDLSGYIWVVDSHVVEDRDFDSIQVAVQKATDNDLILVRPSTYEETIVVSRKFVTVMGAPGEYKPRIDVEGGFCIRARNTKSVFKNLSINQLGGGNYYAFDIASCSPRVENCELTSQSLASVGIAGLEANPIIRNNKISGGTSGIAVTNNAQCIIEGNEIFENENAAIVINNEAEAKIFGNIIRDVKSTGINAYNTAFANIEDNELIDCEIAAIGINNQCDIVVKHNKIIRGGLGIIVTENSKCEIVENQIEKCLEIGVTVKNNSEAEILGNTISRCKKSAILVGYESSANIQENDINKNTKDQIIVSNNSNPQIKGNTIKEGSNAGITVFEACKPIIDSNEICENAKAGIQINENSDAEIFRNEIWGNATGIIILQQSATLIQENDIFRNEQACVEVFFDSDPVIKNNNLHEGKLFGIILRRHSKGKIFENRIWNHEKVGIRINDGSNPEIRGNLIYDNKWNGVKIHKNGKGIVEDNEIYNNKVGVRIEDPVLDIGENDFHDNHKNDVIRID